MARRKRSRRHRRRRNPIPRWGIALGATAAVAAVGYGGYRYWKSRKTRGTLPGLEGAPGPGEIACEIGPDYPGFVQAQDGACIPSGTTPPGIYVDKTCTDFIFVPGDDGPQPDNLDLLIAGMVVQSKQANGQSADPLVLSIGFLHKFWPACNWPPEASSPPRLVHMFEALNFLLARSIVDAGGRVLGTKDAAVAAELTADRLTKLGLPEFDLQIVPELAEWVGDVAGGGLGKGAGIPTPTEIERLKKKLCDDPDGFTAFEKIAFINGVVSPLLDARVDNLGGNPTLAQIDAMFDGIANTIAHDCPIPKRAAARVLAKKFAHDLWVSRYHGGVGIDTSPPPTPPPPVQGGGGIKPPPLPACAIDPFTRSKSVTAEREWWKNYAPLEMTVFEYSGEYAKCDDYDLTIGVCLQIDAPAKPYGHLSDYSPNFGGYLEQFAIQNTQNQPITWSQFRSPPTFKRQLHWRLRKVLGNIEISPVTDIAGSAAGNLVDPCAGQAAHWPIPAGPHFNVMSADGTWLAWAAEPKLELVKHGTKISLRVTYTGVPAFAAGQGGHYSARVMLFPSTTKIQIHSMAKGRTP